MIDEHTIELIQADVDGELPDRQRAELSQYLLSHPEGRALRDELGRLRDALGQVPLVEPPVDLQTAILGEIGAPAPVGRAVAGRWLTPGSLRYAAVFAGGLLAGTIAMQLGANRQPAFDISQVAGTMASEDPVAKSAPVDTLKVSLEQVRGSVSLFRSPTMRVVEFDLVAKEPVEVVVNPGSGEARFSGFGVPQPGEARRYALVLDGPGQAGVPVRLQFRAEGKVVLEGTLEVPVSQ